MVRHVDAQLLAAALGSGLLELVGLAEGQVIDGWEDEAIRMKYERKLIRDIAIGVILVLLSKWEDLLVSVLYLLIEEAVFSLQWDVDGEGGVDGHVSSFFDPDIW